MVSAHDVAQIINPVAHQGQINGGLVQGIGYAFMEELRVEEGSLYPALRRLELDGLIDAEWGTSENNRRARYYQLTRAGRRRLVAERDHWQDLAAAIARVMEMVR